MEGRNALGEGNSVQGTLEAAGPSVVPAFPVAIFAAVEQIAVGLLLFHAVNLRPKNPGTIVACHQRVVLLITVAVAAVLR